MKKPMRVVITGAGGLLGSSLSEYLDRRPGFRVVPLSHREADVTNRRSLAAALKRSRPDAVVNCAAEINVDRCERDPAHAFAVNAFAPWRLFAVLRELRFAKTAVVQMSTSDVFGNNRTRFREADVPEPVNAYGSSKYVGERLSAYAAARDRRPYAIIRTSWLYGEKRETFVDIVARALRDRKPISLIADQRGIPTWTRDVACAIEELFRDSRDRKSGIYHFAARASAPRSKYEIGREIARMMGASVRLLRRASAKDIFEAPRPRSVLLINTRRPPLPDWRDSLRAYLLRRGFVAQPKPRAQAGGLYQQARS